MNFRCYNPKCEHYHRYGGRGIQNEFKTFEEFYNYMYKSFVEHVDNFGLNDTTIDRIDNNKNYCIGNVKWSTRKEQAQHRNTTVYYKVVNTINNEYYIVGNAVEFCKRCGFAWTSFNTAAKSGKQLNDFYVQIFDETDLSVEELNAELIRTNQSRIPVTGYHIFGFNADFTTFNLKEACRNLGIDPSAAYKCAKGLRSKCGGYFIDTVVIYV